MSTDRSLCVLPHRDSEQREADTGLLCRWHRGRLDTLTGAVRDDFLSLALIIEAGSAPKDNAPKTRRVKSASPAAPVNLDVVVLRDPRTSSVRLRLDQSRPSVSVLSVVASWVLLLAEERPLTVRLPGSVIGQLDLLTRHHDWIAAQPWVDDYHAELTELRRAINGALRDKPSEHVGRCYLDTDNGQTCGGSLARRLGADEIRCSRDRSHTWVTPQELARLEIALNGNGKATA